MKNKSDDKKLEEAIIDLYLLIKSRKQKDVQYKLTIRLINQTTIL